MEVITLLEKLETFKIVYETQNFSKAAELLFVSQPTVSAHIKQLEEELNTQLFIRNGRMNISKRAEFIGRLAASLSRDPTRYATVGSMPDRCFPYFCDLFAAGFADALIHSLSPHPISSRDDELCRCPACGRATRA